MAKDLLSSDFLRCFVQKKYRKIYDAATRYTTIQYILAQVKTVLKYSFSSPFKQFPNSSPPTSLFKYFHFFTHHYHLRFTLPSVNTTIAQLHRIFSLGAEVYFSWWIVLVDEALDRYPSWPQKHSEQLTHRWIIIENYFTIRSKINI